MDDGGDDFLLLGGRCGPHFSFRRTRTWPMHQFMRSSLTSESTRPITVLHVAESFSSGVASAIHACVEAQPENVEAKAYGYRIPGVQLAGEVELPIPFYDLPAGKLKQLLTIRSIVAEQRPDVLHLHSSWAGFLARVLPLPRSTRIVYTPHCWAFQRRDLSPLKRAAFLAADKLVGRRTDVVLACSIREAELAREFKLARTVLHLPQQLPNNLKAKISVLSAAELTMHQMTDSEPLTVAMSGRICTQKGVDFFAAVARGLRATPAGRQGIKLKWIGGGGSEAHLAELLAAGIEVTGWLEQDVAVKELADCDIYLHTAAWEGYPMTILEAFELNLPVVARAIAALVSEPRGARLVADPAEAITELLTMAQNWPVAAAMPQLADSLEGRQQVLAAAYGS
jgi:glycosyltransferase involved in cell wall biosynthesis